MELIKYSVIIGLSKIVGQKLGVKMDMFEWREIEETIVKLQMKQFILLWFEFLVACFCIKKSYLVRINNFKNILILLILIKNILYKKN